VESARLIALVAGNAIVVLTGAQSFGKSKTFKTPSARESKSS
jgi:hypothetical protein